VHCSQPPKQMSQFSKNGLKRAILDPRGRGKLFHSDCSLMVKASPVSLKVPITVGLSF